MNVRISGANSNRYTVRLIAVALLATFGLVATSAVPSSSLAGSEHATSSVAVKTRTIKHLGVVLVNSKGRTLYVFMPDKHRRVTCTGTCASFWPPLKLKGSSKPKAGGSAKTKLLGSDRNPSGGRVVTYNKWPLYTYTGDSAAGQATGQGLDSSGGRWYAISASGTVVKHM
jgi:predicted lipoprotein with Yx(FWY)xxD motif